MGWANCGEDSRGRPIGYAHPGECDHPGCNIKIDRGLAFVCGGMHGEDESSCEGYFCSKHRYMAHDVRGDVVEVCDKCRDELDSYYKEHGVKCPDCDGTGHNPTNGFKFCNKCLDGVVLPCQLDDQ